MTYAIVARVPPAPTASCRCPHGRSAPARHGGVAMLVALGIWQSQRLAWKTAIDRRIEARLAAEPVAVPAAPDRSATNTGGCAPGACTRASCTSTPRSRAWRRLPGDRAVHAATTAGASSSTAASCRSRQGRRPAPRADRHRGVLRWPHETDGFTSEPDREEQHLVRPRRAADGGGLGHRAGDAGGRASDDPAAPLPTAVTASIPNDHLGYAITWFSLAAVWAMMTGYAVWRIKRRID